MSNSIDSVGAASAAPMTEKIYTNPKDLQGEPKPGSEVVKGDSKRLEGDEGSVKSLSIAAANVQSVVNSVAQTNLSFSLEQELNRMVVAVREVGSDEILRQFPPEEFLTVAKFIVAQNPEELDEDFLKGILYDHST